MGDLYAEAGVKRKDTMGTYLKRVLLIVAVVSSFILSSFIPLVGVAAAIFIVLAIYMYPKLNIEFEYVFVDGQFDFDKIMGKTKRKTVLQLDFERIQVVAPKGSHALDDYNHLKDLKIRDYSSLREDVKPYIMIAKIKDETCKVIFEPNEKMIDCMKQKAPRKVFTY